MSSELQSPESILVIDDELAVLRSIRRTLRTRGYEQITTCEDSRESLEVLRRTGAGLVLLDLMMPHLGGEEVLAQIQEYDSRIPVVIITAEQDARTAVRCLKSGAYDYLVKPVTAEDLVAVVARGFEHTALQRENEKLRRLVLDGDNSTPEAFAPILTRDGGMRRLFGYLEAISGGNQPVLITGETGTGKELVARGLHTASGCSGPFVAVNAAGLDDMVFSDTLFGHRSGAFTGAIGSRSGMIEKAAGGTLFLDEIGDLAEASQIKLLRLIQEREYHPLGSDSTRQLRARVVAATHRPATALRSDLYFRLRAYQVRIPPLRERQGDLPLLVRHFLGEAAVDLGRSCPEVPEGLFDHLAGYRFPGNVRELQSMVFEALARHVEGPLPIEPFVELMVSDGLADSSGITSGGESHRRLLEALQDPYSGQAPIPDDDWAELQRANLTAALRRSRGRISGAGGAAERLGLKASTLESRLKTLQIDHREFRD